MNNYHGIPYIKAFFSKNKAFIGYLTAGDGSIQRTLEASLALIEGGVNMLEIGVPFSDPVADGPVIQRAATRALKSGTNLEDILWLAEQLRQKTDIPLILFSYLNPILAVIQTDFLAKAKLAGIDGMLIVDCPLEESDTLREQCLSENIAPIYVIAPSTSLSRLRRMDKIGKGFLYYACRKGTTGIRTGLPDDFALKMQEIQSHVHLPVVTGFGISEKNIAKQVLEYSQGVVIGSLFVKAVENNASFDELKKLALSINPFI
jgi:tryptophan synthase alpha chain